jgi:hypothetical protein
MGLVLMAKMDFVVIDDHVELLLERALKDDVAGGAHLHVAVLPGGPLGGMAGQLGLFCNEKSQVLRLLQRYSGNGLV